MEAKAQATCGGLEYLRDALGADLALVQEAVPPADLTAAYRQIDDANWRYKWGSAVVALRPGLTIRERQWVPLAQAYLKVPPADALPESHRGGCAVADVLDSSGRCLFTAVSLYGQWEFVPGGKTMFACTRRHRMLSDLTGILAASRRRPMIIAAMST